MPKIQLRKNGVLVREIIGRRLNAPQQLAIGNHRLDLTENIALTNGRPTLELVKNSKRYYIREKFNKTDTIHLCAKTPNPRNSSKVYRVDNYKIQARAINLSKLKIDVTTSTAGSHRNDGDRIARGHVVLEAFNGSNKVFSKTIWSDQTNGGDGASGFERGTIFNKSLATILSNSSQDIVDLSISVYLSTGDYQAHVHGGRHRYQRVHGICVTVYD